MKFDDTIILLLHAKSLFQFGCVSTLATCTSRSSRVALSSVKLMDFSKSTYRFTSHWQFNNWKWTDIQTRAQQIIAHDFCNSHSASCSYAYCFGTVLIYFDMVNIARLLYSWFYMSLNDFSFEWRLDYWKFSSPTKVTFYYLNLKSMSELRLFNISSTISLNSIKKKKTNTSLKRFGKLIHSSSTLFSTMTQ